jgi:shikimate dehydrogenase
MKKLFVIFGNPVSHSKSPLMHNFTLKGLGINGCYGRYLLKNGDSLREKFFELDLSGANITVPYKEEAFRACDELDEFAKKIGAVNTIVRRGDKLYGYNTDALGFLKAISEFKNIKRVLFLGAGGTAKATSRILKDRGFEVEILNRSEGRLKDFKDEFKTYTFDTFKSKKNYDLVVNMTSAGLSDNSLPAPIEILEGVLEGIKGAVDVIYGKETPFLKLAKSKGIKTKDGEDMLIYQGVIAFQYFIDESLDFELIEKFMRKAFK